MKIGMPEYEISYVGDPVGLEINTRGLNPVSDVIEKISGIVSYNSTKGIWTTIIDTASFDSVDEIIESFAVDSFDTSLLSVKSSYGLYFYISRDYYLGSQSELVVEKTKSFLTFLSHILERFSINSGIVCRIGSAYGNRKKTMSSFLREYKSLPDFVRSKIILTNDDRPSLFSVKDLLSEVCLENNIPISFRSLSHYFNSGSLFHGDALKLSCSTWPKGRIPLIIHSESKSFNSDGIPESRNPSDYLSYRIPTFGMNVCVAIDSGYKELSCLKYLADYKSLGPVVINRIK